MTKLYKEIDGKIHYWEIWKNDQNSTSMTIHWGVLGDWGEKVEIIVSTLEEAANVYENKVKEKENEGFGNPAITHQMILQFHTDDSWGNINDLDFRNEMWDHLNGVLGWTGNGAVHGGDIGSGTINLFFDAVDPNIAIQSIVSAFQYLKLEKKYIIALESISTKQDAQSDFEIKVLYPQNYKSEFNY